MSISLALAETRRWGQLPALVSAVKYLYLELERLSAKLSVFSVSGFPQKIGTGRSNGWKTKEMSGN